MHLVDMTSFEPLPTEGYLVGGALRDVLLGMPAHEVKDIDWAVPNPHAEALRAAHLLNATLVPLGTAHGTYRVVADGGRVRDYTLLESSIAQDLGRRDFTINTLAASLAGELVDEVGGLADLKQQQVRMVSLQNLCDDPLRLLRAVRFATVLDFQLEPSTASQIQSLAKKLPLSAPERIQQEFNYLLLSSRAGHGMVLLQAVGLLERYLPELARAHGVSQGGFHHLDVLQHSFEALNQLVQGFPDAPLALRWATLLHDVGKPETKTKDPVSGHSHFYGHDRVGAEITRQILTRFMCSEAMKTQASQWVKYHMIQLPKTEKEARRFVHRRRELLPELLMLMIADREAARGPLSSEATRQRYSIALSQVLGILAEPLPAMPLLDGRDIMALLSLQQGPEIGQAVRFLAESVSVGDVRTRDEAEAALKHYAVAQGWLE